MIRSIVRTAAQSVPLVILTANAFADLERECRGQAQTLAFLIATATASNRPIGIHGDGVTMFLAPRSWTRERLAGYVAGRHEELAGAFGEIAGVTSHAR